MRVRRLLYVFIWGGAAALISLFYVLRVTAQSSPASLYLSPSSGTYIIGSTFAVSIFVNTNGQSVNAVQADLRFPADKLQVVSPSAGKSFVSTWVAQPTYDNRIGSLKFQGAVPTPGINTSAGLVSEITFRAISVGAPIVRFEDSSRVLLNDGKGTDVLGQTTGGVFNLALPPPSGPSVSSPTHQDQEKWYATRDVTLRWGTETPVRGYSYVLSEQPIEIPDDISEGLETVQAYRDLPDGIHYFHVKALRDGSWGGVTHFAIKIDSSPPANFKIEITPGATTSITRPIINFQTTDALSGLDHYEIKLISLTPREGSSGSGETEQGFFIEANSPYVPRLDYGDYDVIVRAYDKAGNYVQHVQRLIVTTALSSLVDVEGVHIGDLVIAWSVIWSLGAIVLFLVTVSALRHHQHHKLAARQLAEGVPNEIKNKLKELNELQEKYRKLTVAVLLCVSIVAGMFSSGIQVSAQEEGSIELSPPDIIEISDKITNQEIFYIGGRTLEPSSDVIIYIQGLESGETLSYRVRSNSRGDWFYRHNGFLAGGQYSVWTQTEKGALKSPPSAQSRITVSATALQLGTSRLSYEAIYFITSVILLAVIMIFAGFGLYHRHHGRKKRELSRQELRNLELALHRGFALLERDIKSEIARLHKARGHGAWTPDDEKWEATIKKDLERVRTHIGREVWHIEKDIDTQ